MNDAPGRSRGGSSSAISDRQTAAAGQLGSETIDDSRQPEGPLPSSRVVAYRGVRGLKHRNDRLQRSAAAVLGRPPDGTAASERQNVADRCPSSSDQPRPVRSTSSRRSVSADRQAESTNTPRTLFETLYQEKVDAPMQGYPILPYLTFGLNSLLNRPLSAEAVLVRTSARPRCNEGHRNLCEVR